MILEPAYFDQMYAESADPWGFTSRWYEKRKYALTAGHAARASATRTRSSPAAPSGS